jgi:exonuclease SbcD
MRILHTADWHLGQSLPGVSLIEDQRFALEQIITVAEEERPDVVIIAGDVFDRAAPSPDAVALLDWAISRLVLDLGRRVILIAGNHDSGERIGCFSDLLQQRGLHLFGTPRIPVPSVTLEDNFGHVRFFVLPYLEPQLARFLLNDESIKTQQHAYEAVLGTITIAPGERAVFVGHAFLEGGEASGSERQLSVGGSEAVSANLFAPFVYVAMGHLHRPQLLLKGKIRYPGSLLAHAFDEAGQQKSIELGEIGSEGAGDVRRIPIIPRRAMRRVKGRIINGEFVIEPEGILPGPEDFLEVTLRNDEPVADAMSLVQAYFPNALSLKWERARIYAADTGVILEQMRQKTPLDLLQDFFHTVKGKKMTEIQLALGRGALENAERETGS